MLLIFDLDGTLFQAKPVLLNAETRFLHEIGITVENDTTEMKRISSDVERRPGSTLPIGAAGTEAHSRYLELITDEIKVNGKLFPGVYEMISYLACDDNELFICSNSPAAYIEAVLEHTKLKQFKFWYMSADRRKSKAELIRVIAKPNVPAVVIGDTHGDVEAAHEVGLPAIAAAYGYGNKTLLSSAEYIANTPEEIIEYIKRIKEGMK